MTSCMIDIRLKRVSKEYSEGEIISGDIIVSSNSSSPIQHNGIFLILNGMVNINLSTKNVGVFEAFYNSTKPIQLIDYSLEISKAGKFPVTEQKFHLKFH